MTAQNIGVSSEEETKSISPFGYTLEHVMKFLDESEAYIKSDAYLEAMGKDMENVNMKEKEGLIRDRFQVENKKLWTKVVLNDSKKTEEVDDDFLNIALQYYVNQKREFSLYQRYQQFAKVERDRFLVALYGKEIYEQREKQQQLVQEYGRSIQGELLALTLEQVEEKLKILHPIVAAWNATLDKIPQAEQDIYCAKQPLDAMKPMIQMQILQQVMQMRLQEANGNDDDCNNKGGG